MKTSKCKHCGAIIDKDCIALNKKLDNPDLEDFLCLVCLADRYDCTVDDLKVKIEEFKEQGCTLFK